jgi:hypothetical protein
MTAARKDALPLPQRRRKGEIGDHGDDILVSG